MISSWFDIFKKQERTFVIEEITIETEFYDKKTKEPYKDISINAFITAKELGIEEDFTVEDIQDELLEWIEGKVGRDVEGYLWHEITAEGKKRDWLNPRGDYELV